LKPPLMIREKERRLIASMVEPNGKPHIHIL